MLVVDGFSCHRHPSDIVNMNGIADVTRIRQAETIEYAPVKITGSTILRLTLSICLTSHKRWGSQQVSSMLYGGVFLEIE